MDKVIEVRNGKLADGLEGKKASAALASNLMKTRWYDAMLHIIGATNLQLMLLALVLTETPVDARD